VPPAGPLSHRHDLIGWGKAVRNLRQTAVYQVVQAFLIKAAAITPKTAPLHAGLTGPLCIPRKRARIASSVTPELSVRFMTTSSAASKTGQLIGYC